jgi:hypothetical protein
MRMRGITDAAVEYVLEHYHTSYTDRNGNQIFVGTVGDRRLKVVVAQGSSVAICHHRYLVGLTDRRFGHAPGIR